MKRIFIVEDEKDIANVMRAQLEIQGHQVHVVFDGKEAFEVIQNNGQEYDLIILDRMLPNASGLEICQLIRRSEPTQAIPVLMVTALSRPEEVIEGLNKGADDYMIKPFDMNILVARVNALLRRYELLNKDQQKHSILDNGVIRVDLDQIKAFASEKAIELTKSEFKLLVALIESTGKVLTRKKLVEIVQEGPIHVTERTIDTHVFGLRKKLGAASRMIETIRGIGYRIISE